jgi:hypothetical protein
MIQKRDKKNKKFYAAYIHFKHWFDNTAARNFQSRVLNPAKEARIVYDDPWYWIVLPYKNLINNKLSKSNFAERKCSDESEVHNAKVHPDEEDIASTGSRADDWNLEQTLEQMEEIEDAIAEDEKYLVSIDSRYLKALEQENLAWRQWAQQLFATKFP